MSTISIFLEQIGREVSKIVPLYTSDKRLIGEIIHLVPLPGLEGFRLGYCRVSTIKQAENNSLLDQAYFNGSCEIIIWEIGSGYDAYRPGLEEVNRIIASKLSGTLGVRFLHRLTRSQDLAIGCISYLMCNNWSLSATDFWFNEEVALYDYRYELNKLLYAMRLLEDNAVSRQAGINRKKQLKGSYPGRKSIINKTLYKKYVSLKKKHPEYSNKLCYVALGISKSTFHRMLIKYEKGNKNM